MVITNSDGPERREQYKRLRNSYDEAFRRMVEHQRQRDEQAVARIEKIVRHRRNLVADFLLATTQQRVQKAAYFVWLNAGCPGGTSASDWTAAQRQQARV